VKHPFGHVIPVGWKKVLEIGEHKAPGIGQKQQTEVRRHSNSGGEGGDREGERKDRRKSEEDAKLRERPTAQATSGHCNTKRRRGA
jgi:hypothetical protein